MEQQPLLSSESRQYQSLGRSTSSRTSLYGAVAGAEVSAEEVKAASSFASHRYYPPSIHSALLSSPDEDPYQSDPLPPNNNNLAIVPQGGSDGYQQAGYMGGSDYLDEVEIRQLLIDHVGHNCCWGGRPARKWTISAIEDCNVYAGTLETFLEERECIVEKEPYTGGEIDGKGRAAEIGLWELDLRAEFPMLFVTHKEVRVKIPHSEAIEKCIDCEGRGETPCPTCNAGQERGFYKENQTRQCTSCHGRGLIAHRDGSDTICTKCGGKGRLSCDTCGSRGLIKCKTCEGHGSLLTRKIALVRWRTLSTRKVSATSGAASVPDEVFHNARGVQLCNVQAFQCTPAFFADSYPLNQLSHDVIASRLPLPPSARVISERHIISVVPVTRVTMTHRNRSFIFYIVGYSREVFLRDYPSKFCWGLCCCF